jgi:hypothetical protein
MSDTAGYLGAAGFADYASRYASMLFVAQQVVAQIEGGAIVQVLACTSTGAVAAAGTVTVQPLVNQIDGYGNAVPHGPVYNLPYIRLQAGPFAIIADPVAGDIGVAIISSRDTSRVRATGKQANPGSRRQFSFSDGIYLGGCLNVVPTEFVQFSSAGITVTSATAVTLVAPAVYVGATGGKRVVLDGDPVSGGAVHASSTKAWAT